MKLKIYSIALLAGLLCMSVAQAQSFSPPWDSDVTGYLVVYDIKDGSVAWDGGAEGTDITGPYALANLRSLTSDFLTFDLLPETNKYWNGTDAAVYWQNGSGDGGKYLDSLTFWNREIIGTESNVVFDFTINANTLVTNRYEVIAFIKVVDINTGNAFAETNLNVTGLTGNFVIDLADSYLAWSGAPLQAGFRVSGTNANPANAASYGGVNVTVNDVYLLAPDITPPSPDPLTWDVVPYTVSDDKIGMTLTTATDLSGVEYRILGYKGATIPGGGLGYDSGWVSDPHHMASGLLPSQQYTFRAYARDLAEVPNATGFTPNASATTIATDTTIPQPDPAEIASIVASPISVWLTAAPVTDASVVEYNFVPTSTNNNAVASGWQTNNEYVAYGLIPDTLYEYTVKVRDLSAATNTTGVSDPVSASTLAKPASGSFTNTLQGFTAGNSTSGSVVHELAMAGFELASLDAAKAVTLDANGLTFGDINNQTFESRNVLRTIASDYGDGDFQITVTCNNYSNLNEQVCFLGAGHGLQAEAEYLIPDFFLEGVSGVLSEVRSAGVNLWSWFEGTEQAYSNDTGVVTLINQVRMTYDSTAETILLEVDWDADGGGGFVSDQTLGPLSTTNVWQTGAPQKVYISGAAGVTITDLEVVFAGPSSVAVENLTIVSVSGDTATLQWTGLLGQTYNVIYKTNLGALTWTTDPGNTGLPGVEGTQSTTATVAGDSVFYRVESE